jgi:hypothetical protein
MTDPAADNLKAIHWQRLSLGAMSAWGSARDKGE